MSKPKIAIIGGAGQLGGGLAFRLAKAGYPLVIGSRTAEKAEAAAQDLKTRIGGGEVGALENGAAAAGAEIVIVAVPFAAQKDTLLSIKPHVQGKVVIDATVALVPPKVGTVQLPPEGSAGVIAHNTLGEGVKLVSAFQNVPAHKLLTGEDIDCDVLVCSNDRAAAQTTIELCKAIDMQAYDAGVIQNSAAAEALTSVLISIGRRHKAHPAIRLTGLGSH